MKGLLVVQGIGSKSVPELPAEERDTYIRQVSSTVGLAALAATVVRVAPGLLLSLCSPGSDKSDPILAELGKLERHILLQLAVAETWKRSHDASKGKPACTLVLERNAEVLLQCILMKHLVLCCNCKRFVNEPCCTSRILQVTCTCCLQAHLRLRQNLPLVHSALMVSTHHL